ncbi:hypothetical protein DNTS_022914 [Danionella cerebrum]|uniref:DSN1 component of MIS12 kinetochore complex n=1 Tax=Danionella cerebrum TaxID=2873325 RepID=A0A553REX8_9TELE|nr:hypothetical protein DNTS_022914 [Danionella translucida]
MAELSNERCDGNSLNVGVSEVSHGVKRPHDSDHMSGPPHKSPCTSPSPAMQQRVDKDQPDDSTQVDASLIVPAPERSPRSRRKSLRRSSRGRRSLPAFSGSVQPLCETICLSLTDNERLEMLMKAAMQRTVQRVRNSLYTIPGIDTETLQTQDIRETQSLPVPAESDPAVNETTTRTQDDINRLQAESLSWETLLNKHRSKADYLDKCVEGAEERGVPLDPLCFSKSSHDELIRNKPDYKAMDSQCCLMRELLSFHEKSQLLLKETSARLASRAGFEKLSSSPVRELLRGPLSGGAP